MIKINLLPTESGKKSKAISDADPSRSVFGVLLAALLVALGGAGFYGYSAYGRLTAKQDDLKKIEKRRDEKKKELEKKELEYAAFAKESEEIEEKFAVVQGLSPQNRVFWSEKLNMLARARFDLAVYITGLTLTERIEEVETPESVKRRQEWEQRKDKKPGDKPPKPIKQPIINQTLEVDAVAYGENSPQQLRQVKLLNDNLVALTWTRESGKTVRFMEGLKRDFIPKRMETTELGGVEVLAFGYIVEALPQLDRSSTTATAALRPQVAAAAGSTTGTAAGEAK